MTKYLLFLFLFVFTVPEAVSQEWQAHWISSPDAGNSPNTWLAFRKSITIGKVPAKAIASIAADSKYWLWINGEIAVFEGGLKRGPNANDTYYDEVDIARWLKPGENLIGVMVWYFGKDGFSHNSSGKAGLLFDCPFSGGSITSDHTWGAVKLAAYSTAPEPLPNYRLPESSIRYDAGKAIGNWYADASVPMGEVVVAGKAGAAPWNKLVARPIPLFKNSGLKKYEEQPVLKSGSTVDTLICQLPYNAQITPYFKIQAPEAGLQVTVFTDNYLKYNGGADYIRSEYITSEGVQEYESLGWVNGHYVYYLLPKGVKVLDLMYRETGYDASFGGNFTCSDPFFNKLWEKSLRTLYLNMRDTYMDCPDRERAQWTGDAVNQSGQSFYSLSTSSHALAKKWLYEIVDWQKPDGTLFAPVPASNWDKELPDQLLATIGYYGLWNYYLHTGDRETLAHAYEPAKKYLSLWKPDGKGLVNFRGGDWTWGDWGDEKDMELIFHGFYYLALKGMQHAATALGKPEEANHFSSQMMEFKTEFNKRYWNGKAYRNPEYKGKTDDRVQALAVVSGLADKDKFGELLAVFKVEEHASPYMEKYVMEALFQMGEADFALERHKKRFATMVNHPEFSTLWEGWNFNDPKYGGGTINHSWSGGALTVLSQYLCGIAPLEPGYKLFQIQPNPGNMKQAAATVPSVAGEIKASFVNTTNQLTIEAVVPQATSAVISLPAAYSTVSINGKVVWQKGKYTKNAQPYNDAESGFLNFKVDQGNWKVVAKKASK